MTKQNKTLKGVFIEGWGKDRQSIGLSGCSFLLGPRVCTAFDPTCKGESQVRNPPAELGRVQEFEKNENDLLGRVVPCQRWVAPCGLTDGGVQHGKKGPDEEIWHQAVVKYIAPFQQFQENLIRRGIAAPGAKMRKKEP